MMVVPDQGGKDEKKINFSNLFAFLSSLDYLAFLEREGAFRYLDQSYLYYTEEKTHLWLFVFKEYLKWVSMTYLITGLSFSLLLGVSFIASTLISAFIYGLVSLWIVHRYLWGKGYLYQVLRDFLWSSFWLSLIVWLGVELLIFYTLPYVWSVFEKWLFTPDKSTISQLLYPSALYFYMTLKQFIKNATILKTLINSFFLTLPIKVFAFLIPIFYFYYIRRFRQSTKDHWMSLIRKVPD